MLAFFCAGLGSLMPARDRAFFIQPFFELAGEVFVVTAHPFQDHAGMFHFFAHVVQQDFFELFVFTVVGALAVPLPSMKRWRDEVRAFLCSDVRVVRADCRWP